MTLHIVYHAISPSQHKGANWPVFVIGAVGLLVLYGVTWWIRRRR